MKSSFAAVIFAFAGVASSALAASDPALLGLVMPDAKIVAGIQVSQSQSSPFGQYLLSQIKPDPKLDRLAQAIGFDPRRDLTEIIAATGRSDGSADGGLILGRGTFDPAKIATAAVLGGAVTSSYKGFEILGDKNGGKNGGIVFLDSGTVAVGDTASIKAVIDRRIVGTVFSGPIADQAAQVSANNDAWFVAATPSSFLAGKLPPSNPNGGFNPENLFQSVLRTSGGVKFNSSGVTLSADALTNSDKDAQALADVLRFAISMVQVNRNQNPGTGKAASLADLAMFAANGPVMHVTLSVPEQQLEQLLSPPAGATPKRVARR